MGWNASCDVINKALGPKLTHQEAEMNQKTLQTNTCSNKVAILVVQFFHIHEALARPYQTEELQ